MAEKCPLCGKSIFGKIEKDHFIIFGRCFECDKEKWGKDELNDILKKKGYL